MKDRFKPKDWEQLLRLPIVMFQFVALADKQLQAEEANAFASEIQDALRYKDPLHRALFTDLADTATFKKTFEEAMRITNTSVEAIEAEFKGSRKILKKKLSGDEYNRFFASLTGTGMTVARSSGSGVDGVAPEEVAAMTVVLSKFDVDLDAGKRELGKL
jgi:hypothetical protein